MIPTTQDVNVIETNMPTSVAAYVTSNADATYTIFLNARLTWERRLDAYQHELRHIQNGDYERHSADMIEMYSHGYD